MFQTKEQGKTPEEDLNEMEIGNLANKKFKEMVINMFNKYGRMNEHRSLERIRK